MADRRMFSKKIIEDDNFTFMPLSSQALYFHLGMQADDDGFLGSPKKVMRSIGASEDDFKILLAKRFIIAFDSGVIVIRHWRLCNYIQKDRYHETIYQDEKNRLYLLPKQGLYVDFPEPGAIPLVELNGDTSAPALPKEGDNHTDMGLFEDFWQMYPRKLSKTKTERVWKKLAPNDELQKQIIETVKSAVTSAEWERENGRYIPAPYRWLENQGWENTYTQVKAKGYYLDEVEEMSFFQLPENF